MELNFNIFFFIFHLFIVHIMFLYKVKDIVLFLYKVKVIVLFLFTQMHLKLWVPQEDKLFKVSKHILVIVII